MDLPNRHYILNDKGEPVPVSMDEYIKHANSDEYWKNKTVARDYVSSKDGSILTNKYDRLNEEPNNIMVSTTFLGINHNHFSRASDAPILYETMIFGGGLDNFQWRYSTREEALIGHRKALARARCDGIGYGVIPADLEEEISQEWWDE